MIFESARGRALAVAVLVVACARPALPPASLFADDDVRDIERLELVREVGGVALTGFLVARSSAQRKRAALALGRMADESTFPALRAALSDADPSVRAEVAFALGIAGDENAPAELLPRLPREPDEAARAAILEALGRTGGTAVLPALAAAASSGPAPLREAALRGLLLLAVRGVPGDDPTARALAAACAREAPLPFLAASVLATMAAPETSRSALADALRAMVPADPETAAARWKALARFASPGDATLFEKALSDRDWRVRVEAARGLASCGREGADRLADWVAAASDPSPHPVAAALAALAPFAARPRVFALAQALAPRCEAAALLERAGQRAATLACAAPSHRRKILHAQVVGELPAVEPILLFTPPAAGRTVAPPLDVPTRVAELALLGRDPDPRVRAAAMTALGHIDAPVAEVQLRDALRDPSPGVLAAAAEAIAHNARERRRLDRDAVPRLAAAVLRLDSASATGAMVALLGALGASGDARAVPALRRAREDRSWSVRRAARDALAVLGDAAPPPRRPPPPTGMPLDLDTVRGRRVTAMVATSRGNFEISLHPDDALASVASFVLLAGAGRFDGLGFRRAAPDFVVWGGEPRGDSSGDFGWDRSCEYGHRHVARGSVGIALTGRDAGGSQFFVAHAAAPHLDGCSAVIGDVVSGQEIVDAIIDGDVILGMKITVE